jgi:type III restriction enzyme
VLSPDLARKYADHVAVGTEDDDGLFDAHVKVAAPRRSTTPKGELDRAADALAKKWLGECTGSRPRAS